MLRDGVRFSLFFAPVLVLGGCPPTPSPSPGGGNDPAQDALQPLVAITSSGGTILQANLAGLQLPDFAKSVELTASLLNVSSPELAAFQWSVESAGELLISLSSTTGQRVTATAVDAPAGGTSVAHIVRVTATFPGENGAAQTAQAQISLVVQPDVATGGATELTAAPFTDPPLGVDASGQITLHGNISGAVGNALEILWEPLDTLPGSIQLPADMTTEDIVLTVVGEVSGVFPFQITVRDQAGNVTISAVNVFLGFSNLLIDVQAGRLQVAPPASGTATFDKLIRTLRSGGNAPFIYTWIVRDAAGVDRSTSFGTSPRLDDPTASSAATIDWDVDVLSTAAPGTYRFFATVTDASNTSSTSSTEILVADVLGLDVRSSSNDYLATPGETISLLFDRTGGAGGFSYAFSQDGPGANAGTFNLASPQTGADDLSTVTWTAPAAAAGVQGTYRVNVTVTDSLGNTATDSVVITVASAEPLSLDARSEFNDYLAAPGETIELLFDRTGGTGTFSYAFSQDGPGASVGSFNLSSPQTSADDLSTVNWTAPTGATVQGSYRITVVVTDALGATATDTLWIIVGSNDTLSLDARSEFDDYIAAPGATIDLLFDRTGGTPSFSYAYSADGPGANTGSFNLASPQVSADDLDTLTWTAPAAAVGVQGTYRITVIVTDAVGDTATDTLWIIVQSTDPLSLDARSETDDYIAAPGDTIDLLFDRTGGTGTFSYAYSADGPGANTGSFNLASPQSGADDLATVSWTAPAAAAGVQGTYRITVVVTDALGDTATDTLFIIVQPDEPLSLDVRSDDNRYRVPPDDGTAGGADTLTLLFDRTGGEPTFTYTYSADGPGANTGTFTPASPQAGEADDITVTWTAPAAAAGVTGTYRIVVVVSDSLGNTATDSIVVEVGADIPLSLNVRSDTYVVDQEGPADPATLTFDVTGGVCPYTYTFDAFFEGGGTAGASYFDPDSPTTGTCGSPDATVVFDSEGADPGPPPPSLPLGFYTIIVTVTDAVGETFVDSVAIEVIDTIP